MNDPSFVFISAVTGRSWWSVHPSTPWRFSWIPLGLWETAPRTTEAAAETSAVYLTGSWTPLDVWWVVLLYETLPGSFHTLALKAHCDLPPTFQFKCFSKCFTSNAEDPSLWDFWSCAHLFSLITFVLYSNMVWICGHQLLSPCSCINIHKHFFGPRWPTSRTSSRPALRNASDSTVWLRLLSRSPLRPTTHSLPPGGA